MAISTNFGTLSEDLLNRGMPIHLVPQGNVSDRESPIGNPRHQYLPLHREEIAAEARGMIAKWRAAGMPLDESKNHPSTEWAHTIGGILMVNGIEGFLDNYRDRFVSDDPIRNSIAVLGVELLDQWLPIDQLVLEVNRLGLVDPLIPKVERSTHEAKKRGLGKVLSSHSDEKFVIKTETGKVRFLLEKARLRFEPGQDPQKRYRFSLIENSDLNEEDDFEDEYEYAGESSHLDDGDPSEFVKNEDLPRLDAK